MRGDLERFSVTWNAVERTALGRFAGANLGGNAREARRGGGPPMSRLERLSRPQGAAKPMAFHAIERRSNGTLLEYCRRTRQRAEAEARAEHNVQPSGRQARRRTARICAGAVQSRSKPAQEG